MGLERFEGVPGFDGFGWEAAGGRSGSLHWGNWVVTVHPPYKTGGFALDPLRHTLHFQNCNAPGRTPPSNFFLPEDGGQVFFCVGVQSLRLQRLLV